MGVLSFLLFSALFPRSSFCLLFCPLMVEVFPGCLGFFACPFYLQSGETESQGDL